MPILALTQSTYINETETETLSCIRNSYVVD